MSQKTIAPLDAIDRKVIESLQEDGRRSNREIARRLGISAGTVRSRIARLRNEQLIRVAAVQNYSVLDAATFYLGISTDRTKTADVARALAEVPEAYYVAILMGKYDVFAILISESRQRIYSLLVEEITAIPGVRHIESTESLRAVKGFSTVAKLK